MRRRALLLAITVLLVPAFAAAEGTITAVLFQGTGSLSGADAARAFGLGPGDEWSESAERAAVEALLAAYAIRGRLEAEATVRAEEEEGGVRLEITVREGAIVPVGRIDVAGVESPAAEEVRDRFDTRAGRVLEPRRLEEDMDRLLRSYARNGRPFARVIVTGVTDEEGPAVGLDLRVIEGPYLTLGDIRVTGNARTRPSTIRRLSGLRFGRAYDQNAVDASRQRLLRSGLFRDVAEPTARIDWDAKSAIVELKVEEAPTNRIAGVLGYAPGVGEEKGVFTGFVDVEFRNILGTARSGGARWERISPESRHAVLFYREPWVLGGPFSIGGRVEQTLRDSTYSRVTGALSADVDLSRRVSASFSTGVEDMKPRSETSVVPKSRRTTGGAAFRLEGRDFPANPRRGIFFHIGAEYGERKIEEDAQRSIEGDRIRQATLDGGLGLYRRLGRGSVAAVEIEGLGRFTDAAYVPPYDQFYLGGARTLRGYDEDRFRGSRLAWSRVEYRYLLGALSRVFLFADTGYVFARHEEAGKIVRDEFVRTGYGFGLRVDSPAGVIGIDYGLGRGDSFGNGKIHVSAEGTF